MTLQNPILSCVQALTSHLQRDLAQIDNILQPSSVEMLIKNVVSNLMQSGGKRIRPLFVLAFNKLCSNSIPEDLNIIAASIEYIHTATLLHDDVIDNSDSRRGKSTAQKLWGSKASVLVGDFLLSTAFKWLVSSNNSEILKIVSETSVAISRGEIKQLVSKLDFNSHTYYDVIRSKTAVLFAASCEIGAVAGGANYEQRCAAYEFGLNFGIAFQIIDDIMDYVGTETGKPSGADFMNSRITLPLILAYQVSSPNEKEFLITAIQSPNNHGIDQIIKHLNKYNAIDHALGDAKAYLKKSLHTLETFPESNTKKIIISNLEF